MLGLDSEPGVYIQTLNDLFRAIEYSTEDMDCSVYMSYIEVSLIVCRFNKKYCIRFVTVCLGVYKWSVSWMY